MDNNGPLWGLDEAGDYCLVFPNKHALSIDEITEIFSSFGDVISVNAAGDEKGLRFIKFSSLAEAQKAIKELDGHPAITLKPYRRKNKGKDKNDTSISEESKNSSMSKRSSIDNNLRKNKENNKKFSNVSKSDDKASEMSENELVQPKASGYKLTTTGTKSLNNSLSGESSQNPDSLPKFSVVNKVKALMKKRGETSDTFSVEAQKENNSKDFLLLPRKISQNKVKVEQPKQSLNNVLSKKREEILNAHEVVVGNIHETYGSAYILHLMEKWEPLGVSRIKRAQDNPEIRYCHIYFKSSQDAAEVEDKLDKVVLNGKKLVVLRPSQLAVLGS